MLVQQSFGMFNICKDCMLFELCLAKKKKGDEQNWNFYVWFS